jgi:hypothetical protein
VSKQFGVIVFSFLLMACQPDSPVAKPEKTLLHTKCIASQSQCEVTTEKSQYSVRFWQENLVDTIKGETPFTIEIIPLTFLPTKINEPINLATRSIKNSTITKISGYLEGRDMFMGKVPVFFTTTSTPSPTIAQASIGQATELASPSLKNFTYLAETQLANCMAEQMVWRLWITVERAEDTENFFVDFTSTH